MTRPKNGHIWSNISGCTGPIFTVFTPYERALRADDGSVAFFPIYQGTLPWQPNNIAKMYQRRLIPPAFGALELENELQYQRISRGPCTKVLKRTTSGFGHFYTTRKV